MWAKLTHVLKSRASQPEEAQEDHESSTLSPNQSARESVMSKVFEQHPNLSVFHNNSERMSSPSPPPSPTRNAKRSMFKRLSKAPSRDDSDSLQASLPLVGPQKKMKGSLFGNSNNSQTSLSRITSDSSKPSPQHKSSLDMLRPSVDSGTHQNATISAGTTQRQPSLDILRSDQDATPSELSPMTPSSDLKFGSVRSILRDPKTPGTGQNVRFFSRDAYKVISPDPSTETEFQSMLSPSLEPPSATSPEPLFDQLQTSPQISGTFPVTRGSTSNKSARPTVSEVFSSMSSSDTPSPKEQARFLESTNLMSPIPPPDFNDPEMSQALNLPNMPPGLGFDISEPLFDNAIDMSMTENGNHGDDLKPSGMATSTPFRDKGKGKAIDVPVDVTTNRVLAPTPDAIDETIFHSQDTSAQITSALHERSNSSSFSQTVFHSLNAASPTAEASSDSPGSDLKAALFDKDSTNLSARALKGRSRTLGDSVLQSIMRPSAKVPEVDINDESSHDFVVCSNPEQPDPFRANARTYYTPQTMIPVTPPQGGPKHVRKASKEENVIFSLQTQLALQTELCQQYENDLRSRDELVEILGKKLSDVEKEDVKRRSILKTWKKKVQELEKTCRYLEEEVEGSRQSSMERSIMDEASGEALRMLHRQISVLESEKAEWMKKEELLRGDIGALERIVKDRGKEVDQVDTVRCSPINDESELMVETQLMESESTAEFKWEEEKAIMVGKLQHLEGEKVNLEAVLEDTKLQLKTRDDEYGVLRNELHAQWEHTEKGSEKMAALQEKVVSLEEERDALNCEIEGLKHTMANMETETHDGETKKAELEAQLHEVWDNNEELEREKAELENQLQQERDHSDGLSHALQEHADRVSQLDRERQFSQENVSRLEEKLRQRDEEEKDYSQKIKQREAEVEELREEMTNLRREHTRTVDELNRALQEASLQEGEARTQVENLVRQQATSDIEMKSSADKINALKEEVERQRRRIQVLQQESADKEVKLVQLTKQHQRDKDDLEGMNTALDSKQMELELIKRNLGVRGTAGATPAPASRVTSNRRDSAIFSTPTVTRPPSSASEAGTIKTKKRASVVEPLSAVKVSTLGQSTRPNVASAHSTASKRVEGSMGPPPLKTRPSLAGSATSTPTARVSSLSRSSSVKPSPGTPSVSVRRVASVEHRQFQSKPRSTLRQSMSPVSSVSEQEEKENVDTSAKRRSLVPISA